MSGVIYTSEKFHLAVSVPGVTIDSQSWDKLSGAGRTSDTQNYPPGGLKPSVATSGVTKRNPATISRAWDDTLIGAYGDLDNAVGGPITITVQPLANAITSVGKARTYTGVIKSVTPPEQDSTSSSISMLEIEVELNESFTA
jgi:hypothetical protein